MELVIDAINQMSDKRSTGKLAKLEREAHVLAQELRAKTVVQEALDTVSSQLTAVKVRWNACLAGKLPEETEEKEAASPSGQELADTLQQRRNEKNEQRKYKGITGIVLGLLVIIYALLAAGKGYRMLILICGGFSMIAGTCMLLGYAIGREKRQPKPVQPKPLSEEQQKQRASEMETLSRQILQYSRRLDELESESDTLMEKERKLQSLNEELITLREKCDIIQKTKAFLTQAKENYGARYQKPVMDAFRRYYRMLSGEDGTAYGLTATFEMERQEQGMYRDMGYFSRGYQDMTGLCMRLAFADAMYREKKPFLILDDPFSALDRATETEIFAHLRRLAADSVVILISHRLYHFPQMQQIIFMEGGRTTVGTHEELMAKKGAYYKMFQVQSYYYREQGVAVHA